MLDPSELNNLTGLIKQLIRVGIVTSTDDTTKKARVQFKDRNGIVSHELRVIVKNALENKDHWMPDIKEQVLCLFLPTGIETGFIIGSMYSNVTESDTETKEKRRVKFKDGTSVEYDRSSHTLTVDVPADGGNVIVNAHTSVTVNSPKIDLGEPSDLEPSVLGDKLAAWIKDELKPWLDTHTHIGNMGQPTSAAQTAPTGAFNLGSAAAGEAVYSEKNRNQ